MYCREVSGAASWKLEMEQGRADGLSPDDQIFLRDKYHPPPPPVSIPPVSIPSPRGGTVTWPMNNKKSIGNHRRRRR